MRAKELVRTAYRVGTGEDLLAPPEKAERSTRFAFDGRTAALIILVLSLLCGLLVGWTMSRPVEVHALQTTRETEPEAADSSPPPPAAAAAQPSAPETAQPSEPETVTIYISGRVNQPGIIELPRGSRVALAVEQAGGMTPEADMDALNLARVLDDGEHIIVPAPGEETAPSAVQDQAEEPSSPSLININSASTAELETLPGVGPAIAQRIVDWRETNGSFSSVEELMEVSGIGPATFENLRDHITV